MVDLLQEEWEVDGVAAVFSKTTKTRDADGKEYGTQICDLDTGCWEADVDMSDICAFSRLIAAAPEMYQLLTRIHSNEKVSSHEIVAVLKKIER